LIKNKKSFSSVAVYPSGADAETAAKLAVDVVILLDDL
jgi:hypothetical protein